MILTALILSLFCVAVYELQSDGMILNPIRKVFEWWRCEIDRYPSRWKQRAYILISKPVTSCVICFASVWGTIGWLFIGREDFTGEYLYCIIVCSLFNYILYNLVRILEKI